MPRYLFLNYEHILLVNNSIAWYFILPVLAVHFLVVALPSLLSLSFMPY